MTSTRHATQKKTLDERLLHLTRNERSGLAAFVDRLRQRYGDDLQRVVLAWRRQSRLLYDLSYRFCGFVVA